jgi:hypothetical protein
MDMAKMLARASPLIPTWTKLLSLEAQLLAEQL